MLVIAEYCNCPVDKTYGLKAAADKAVVEEEEARVKREAISKKLAAGGALNYLQAQYMALREYLRTAPRRALLMVIGMPLLGLLSLLWLVFTAPKKRPARRPTAAEEHQGNEEGEGAEGREATTDDDTTGAAGEQTDAPAGQGEEEEGADEKQ